MAVKTTKKLTPQQEALKSDIIGKVNRHFGKVLEEATPHMIYAACALTVRDRIMEKWAISHQEVKAEGSKKLYYLSFEFLMGRLLCTNILNLMQTDDYKAVLENLGYTLEEVAELENDAGLGNGGLGRLAACFIDSLTTLDLPAYGCTLRYEYGLFRQKIVDGYQTELPDSWLEYGNAWEVARPEEAVKVTFGGDVHTSWENGIMKISYSNERSVIAMPYDVPLCGYDSKVVNKLRLWSAKSSTDFDMRAFNQGDYIRAMEEKELAEVISKVLYPEDNHTEGKELRLKQQYFLVSATLQWILKEFEMRNGDDWDLLPEKIVIHINDTHLTMAIPEMMRLLMDEKGLGWDEAWDIVTKVFAYTNHTVMSEALEKWPQDMFRRILPRLYMILEEMNRRLMERLEAFYPGDKAKHEYMAILANNQVSMANTCLASCFAINGVSKLHTEILEKQELKDFYQMMPEKFNNKTNGITQRRFLLHANPLLANWVTDKISDAWITNLPEISKLKLFVDDPKSQQEFMNIKYQNKVRLAKYIKEHNGIDVDPRSIFDVQVKRLHEYKRQLLNILHVMYIYNELKSHPDMEYYPHTFIFGAKAAAGYRRAKLTIKLINSVADVINNDKSINGKIKVVFIENYRVSNAEIIFAAADVSEQISTASKEASGTGNMKFMLNGAITCGTLDGANVEILEEVGKDNAVIFGMTADEVINYEKNGGYDPMQIFNENQEIRQVLMQLINGFYSPQDPELFRDIYNSLLNTYSSDRADTYFILKDFMSYHEAHMKINELYQDQTRWAHIVMMNTACSGKFTSDRTIQQYVDEIWELDKVTVEL